MDKKCQYVFKIELLRTYFQTFLANYPQQISLSVRLSNDAVKILVQNFFSHTMVKRYKTFYGCNLRTFVVI